MKQTYNVYIIKDNTQKALSLIGTHLSHRKAQTRETTGLNRIDTTQFSCLTVKVKSPEDLTYQKDINN